MYDSHMENLTLATELTTVSNRALEDLHNMAVVYDLGSLEEVVVEEMHRRGPDFVTTDYGLIELLEHLYG